VTTGETAASALAAFVRPASSSSSSCGGGCGPCSACSQCSGWAPIIGGTGTASVCHVIHVTLTCGCSPAAGTTARSIEASPVDTFSGGSPPTPQTANINAGGGGGYANGHEGTAGGHGGNTENIVIAGVGNNGQSGVYSCLNDNLSINGVLIQGSGNTLGQSNSPAGGPP